MVRTTRQPKPVWCQGNTDEPDESLDRQVVEYLLTKNPDLSVRQPAWNCTALQVARYHKRDEIVALLSSPDG